MQREAMVFDVLIVDGRPGLAAAIRSSSWRRSTTTRSVCLRDREWVEIGAHILSGAVTDPRVLNELDRTR